MPFKVLGKLYDIVWDTYVIGKNDPIDMESVVCLGGWVKPPILFLKFIIYSNIQLISKNTHDIFIFIQENFTSVLEDLYL